MAHYISTVDFKVQFMQVYGIIQNYTQLAGDLEITAIIFLV